MEDTPVFGRFVTLAKRELQAEDVRLLAIDEQVPDAPNVLVARLPDGRHIVASFAAPPKERDVLERRLAMLSNTFADALAMPPSERMRARLPASTTLHEELKALVARARAKDAVVIDANSPVVWGSAAVQARPRARTDMLLRDVSDRELSSRVADDSGPLQDVTAPLESSPVATGERGPLDDAYDAPDGGGLDHAALMSDIWSDAPEEESLDPEVTRRAVALLRSLPALSGLSKGRHFRHVERENEFMLALSFSGIYLLCVVFDGPFDELRAERAAHDALPRIERLVLALPPLDPEPPQPMGGVIALRGRRRR